MDENDISKRSVMILVVLTLLISSLGTLTVLDTISKVQPSNGVKFVDTGANEGSGFVTLKVEKQQDTASGEVKLEILPGN